MIKTRFPPSSLHLYVGKISSVIMEYQSRYPCSKNISKILFTVCRFNLSPYNLYILHINRKASHSANTRYTIYVFDLRGKITVPNEPQHHQNGQCLLLSILKTTKYGLALTYKVVPVHCPTGFKKADRTFFFLTFFEKSFFWLIFSVYLVNTIIKIKRKIRLKYRLAFSGDTQWTGNEFCLPKGGLKL